MPRPSYSVSVAGGLQVQKATTNLTLCLHQARASVVKSYRTYIRTTTKPRRTVELHVDYTTDPVTFWAEGDPKIAETINLLLMRDHALSPEGTP